MIFINWDFMKKILVIEDTLEVRENLEEILVLDGYEVITASNGKIGVQLANEHLPDLIICDVMMPELDGFGVLKILNKQKSTYDIPFIFLTAKAEKVDYRKGMGLGADDYITKPFDDTELLSAIEIRLKKSARLKSIDSDDEGLQRFFSEAKANTEFEKLSLDREVRMFKKGDVIYQEDQKARWLFYVVSGEVKVFQTNDFGKELIINIYKGGEFFGYFPLLKETKYVNSAEATQDSTLRLIPEEDFKLLLFNNRDFAAKFIQMIASEAESNEQLLIDLAYSSVRKKVANALVTLSAKRMDEQDNNISFESSRNDLAELAGVAKETLIRTLGDFKTEKLITVDGNKFTVLSLQELKSMPQ